MLTRGRSQSASSMLLRYVLLFPLATMQAARLNNEGNIIGLRRINYKVGSSDSDINDCRSFGCSNHSNVQINKSLYNDTIKNGGSELEEEENNKNAIEEGRGKKGKKKKVHANMFMILGGITKAAILYFMIHGVALLATKALVVAKAALLIATALALKKSLDNKTSFEIVKHPHYSHVQTHSSSVDYDHSGGNSGSGYDFGSRRK